MKLPRYLALCSLVLLFSGRADAAHPDPDPWAACRFLMGRWIGEGSGRPGEAKGEFSFRPDLQGKVLVRRHRADIIPGPDCLPVIHEDLMVIYPAEEGQPLRAIYFDNEVHVIHYSVHPSDDRKTLTFLSEPEPKKPRFRLTYKQKDQDRVIVAFAVAPPTAPEEFKTYLEGLARREPRSDVGLSLPRGYVCYRAVEPIVIDGKLDEKAWRDAAWTDSFVDIEGDLKPLPRFQTRAKMLWNDSYLYVAAHLDEPHIWGTLT